MGGGKNIGVNQNQQPIYNQNAVFTDNKNTIINKNS